MELQTLMVTEILPTIANCEWSITLEPAGEDLIPGVERLSCCGCFMCVVTWSSAYPMLGICATPGPTDLDH